MKLLNKFYLINECKKGNLCPFRHVESTENAKSNTPCKFFLSNKKCKYGEYCWFNHDVKKEPIKFDMNSFKDVAPLQTPKVNGSTYSEVFKSNFDPIMFREICPSCYVGEECPNGENCRFIHGTKCSNCKLNVIHPINASKNLEHAKTCIKRSEYIKIKGKLTQSSAGKTCGICCEEIFGSKRFGLLPMCQHVFCLECVIEWRSKKEEFDKNVRSCPMCRIMSYFVVPSRYFYDDIGDKDAFIENYKAILKQKPCINFNKGYGFCELGPKCFFKHELPNGNLAQESQGTNPTEMIPLTLGYLDNMNFEEKDESILHRINKI